jgi:flagellar hook-length control protein FliK
MNTSLLTNLLTYSVGVAPVVSEKHPATRNAGQFVVPAPADNLPHANTPETTTTDNTPADAQYVPANESVQESFHIPGKKTMTAKPQNSQPATESQGQTPPFGANVVQVVQSWLALYPLVEHGEEGLAGKMQPKAGYELAQLLADLRADKFPLGAGQTAKPAENNPLLTVGKGQLGPKAVLPDTSGGILAAGTQPAEHKNVDKIQVLNKTLAAAKTLAAQQNRQLLVNADGETTTTGEKPPILDTSTASGSQKAPPSNSGELIPQATADGNKPVSDGAKAVTDGNKAVTDGNKVVTDGNKATTDGNKAAIVGEKPPTAEEPAASVATKTPVLNDTFQPVQDKSTNLQQEIPVGQEKSALVTEKPDADKAGIAQQGNPTAPALSESSDGDTKEQGGSPFGGPILDKLNPAQVQVSTNQTKGRSGSAYNDASNSGFEQMLSSHNAQTPIAEQTSAFSPTAKTAGNPSPSDAFANVGEQIQGSISSSLRQGDQQITIHLNPPELGRVFIKFQEQQGQITGLLQVDKMQTRHEIEQALPQIIQNLTDSGIQIKRLEVTLTDQPQQQPYKDQSLQDSWSHHQAGAEGKNPGSNAAGTNQWLTNDSGYQGISQPQQMLVTDDSINMLV